MDTTTTTTQRHNDTFLMDHATEAYKKGAATLQKINRCRLFLRVTTLSDITDASGRYIEHHVWAGERPKHRKTTLNYPTYERPPKQDWSIFRKFLQRLLINPYDKKSKLLDAYILGPWYTSRHEDWLTNYSTSHDRIYIKKATTIYSYGRTNARNNFQAYTRLTEPTLPNDAIPISITHGLQITGIPKHTDNTPPQQTTATVPTTQTPHNQKDQFNKQNIPQELQAILNNLPPWQRQRI